MLNHCKIFTKIEFTINWCGIFPSVRVYLYVRAQNFSMSQSLSSKFQNHFPEYEVTRGWGRWCACGFPILIGGLGNVPKYDIIDGGKGLYSWMSNSDRGIENRGSVRTWNTSRKWENRDFNEHWRGKGAPGGAIRRRVVGSRDGMTITVPRTVAGDKSDSVDTTKTNTRKYCNYCKMRNDSDQICSR